MPRIRIAPAVITLATAALALQPASAGMAQGPYPPCDPAATAQPVFGSSGYPEADSGRQDLRLFATHAITVLAGLPFEYQGQLVSDMAFDPPPAGLARITSEDLMTGTSMDDFDGLTAATTFIGEAPGTFTLRLTWTQFDSNGRNPCGAAATTPVTLASPTAPLRLGKPKDTAGLGGDESRVTLKIPRTAGDMRPLEVRYRAVRGQRFPGAAAKGRTLALPMRASDPGFHKTREVSVKVGGLRARIEPENGDASLFGFSVLFEIRSAGGTNYGYDLDVRQGGRSVTRLRVAGNCHRIGGFVFCKRKKVKLTP